ncbi:MAG: hypothetical protein U0X73_13405 [Thermoanaerobaculia bacterium]
MKRFLALFVAPVALLLGATIAPLVSGARTLFLRDTLNSHLLNKGFYAEALRHATLPMIDPLRAGGQALLGNLNAVPFYPDNLLFLVGGTIWGLNAHFWIHWIAALVAVYALGRAFDLPRDAAWAGAVAYAFSGYFVSNLNLYNVVAGVALAPALVAAALAAGKVERPGRRLALLGLLWALLLVAGEPTLVVLGLALALAAVAVRFRGAWRSYPWLRAALALGAGTLVAAPQLVEFLRILPMSYRGYWGYSPESTVIGSFHPATAFEWLLPFFFGRPDFGGIWGNRFYDDNIPLYFTLYPGVLSLALLVPAIRSRGRVAAFAAGATGIGLFFALARFNPLVAWIFQLPGARLFRYPIKLWLPVALGASLLVALGWQEARTGDGARRLRRALAALGALYAALWIYLAWTPERSRGVLRALVPATFPDVFVENERLRDAGLALLSLVVVLLLLAVFGVLARRRAELAAALGLALFVAAQLFFLAPAFPTDDAAAYAQPPPLLARLPADAVLAHGAFLELFKPTTLDEGIYPTRHTFWLERRAFGELYPWAGSLFGRRYELDVSPEGLDNFTTQAVSLGLQGFDDRRRLDVLEAFGVDVLLVDRALDAKALDRVREIAALPSFGQTIHAYEILDRAREVELATRIRYVPHMNGGLEALFASDFDPHTSAVLPGSAPPVDGRPGTVSVATASAERFVVETDAEDRSVLLLRRAWLPLWKAAIDGRPAPIAISQVSRLGVELPPGRHRVEVWIDRRPLAYSAWSALAGALGLAAMALAGRRRGAA